MWYSAINATDSTTRILFATSYNGIQWTKLPSVALSPSTDKNAWDSVSVYAPSVIYDGSNFGLWYSGLNQSLVSQIGYATSQDGATWTKSATNPILGVGSPGTWDSGGVEQPSVVLGASGYMLYYDGFGKNGAGMIGLAQSPQGFAVPSVQSIPSMFYSALQFAPQFVSFAANEHSLNPRLID
jgi:predicted GH43/DUF377 family glycosyl hydrolase